MTRPTETVVDLAEHRSQRVLAAAQQMLVPDAQEMLAAEELSRRVAEQLATLPPDQGALLRRKVLVAVHDLEGLIEALQQQLDGLADELRRVSVHSTAAMAYGRGTDHRF
jgi:hypothetical protein